MEKTSKAWAEDIKLPLNAELHTIESLEKAKSRAQNGSGEELEDDEVEQSNGVGQNAHIQDDSAVAKYEDWCREPSAGGLPTTVENAMNSTENDQHLGVHSDETQMFLEQQSKILEAYRARAPEIAPEQNASMSMKIPKGKDGLSEQIGPVQFNMGGIQVDADDMLQRLKVSLRPLLDCLRMCTLTDLCSHRSATKVRQLKMLPLRMNGLPTWRRSMITTSCRVSSVD